MAEISASVGRGGANRHDDVAEIQRRLNEVAPTEGGPEAPLVADGIAGPKTTAAIERFQRMRAGLQRPDGRVDPGGRTWLALEAARARKAMAIPIGRLRVPGTLRLPNLQPSAPPASTVTRPAAPAPAPAATAAAAPNIVAAVTGVTLNLGPILDFSLKPRSKLEVAVDHIDIT